MVACIAGALLAVDLTAAAADFAAGLGGLGALALGGQLAANDQVQDALVDLGGEDRFAQLDLTDFSAYQALTESRITRVPPFGPGTAPRTSSRLRSASTRTTLMFSVVTRSTP